MSSVGFQASKLWVFFWKIYCGASFEIISRQNQFPKASCFWILWESSKYHESLELWLDGFEGNSRHSKMQKISAKFFFAFLSDYYTKFCFF